MVKLIDNAGRRNELDSRIERLTEEQQLALDIVPVPNGAALSMQLRF